MKSHSRGFTLIELLVVIAIIGLLSAVVLASLNSARSKGADASVKSNLGTVRTQANLFYDDNGGKYTGLCANATVVSAIDSAKSAASITAATVTDITVGGSATTAVCHVNATGSAFAVGVPLKSDSANSWCVDSAGTSKQVTAGYIAPDAAVCP